MYRLIRVESAEAESEQQGEAVGGGWDEPVSNT